VDQGLQFGGALRALDSGPVIDHSHHRHLHFFTDLYSGLISTGFREYLLIASWAGLFGSLSLQGSDVLAGVGIIRSANIDLVQKKVLRKGYHLVRIFTAVASFTLATFLVVSTARVIVFVLVGLLCARFRDLCPCCTPIHCSSTLLPTPLAVYLRIRRGLPV
jgi:hypothetical protein